MERRGPGGAGGDLAGVARRTCASDADGGDGGASPGGAGSVGARKSRRRRRASSRQRGRSSRQRPALRHQGHPADHIGRRQRRLEFPRAGTGRRPARAGVARAPAGAPGWQRRSLRERRGALARRGCRQRREPSRRTPTRARGHGGVQPGSRPLFAGAAHVLEETRPRVPGPERPALERARSGQRDAVDDDARRGRHEARRLRRGGSAVPCHPCPAAGGASAGAAEADCRCGG